MIDKTTLSLLIAFTILAAMAPIIYYFVNSKNDLSYKERNKGWKEVRR